MKPAPTIADFTVTLPPVNINPTSYVVVGIIEEQRRDRVRRREKPLSAPFDLVTRPKSSRPSCAEISRSSAGCARRRHGTG